MSAQKAACVQPQSGKQIVAQAQRVLEEAAAIKDMATVPAKTSSTARCKWVRFLPLAPICFRTLYRPSKQQCATEMPLVIEEGYTSSIAQATAQRRGRRHYCRPAIYRARRGGAASLRRALCRAAAQNSHALAAQKSNTSTATSMGKMF